MYKVGEGKWERETRAACAKKTELNLARRASAAVPELEREHIGKSYSTGFGSDLEFPNVGTRLAVVTGLRG